MHESRRSGRVRVRGPWRGDLALEKLVKVLRKDGRRRPAERALEETADLLRLAGVRAPYPFRAGLVRAAVLPVALSARKRGGRSSREIVARTAENRAGAGARALLGAARGGGRGRGRLALRLARERMERARGRGPVLRQRRDAERTVRRHLFQQSR